MIVDMNYDHSCWSFTSHVKTLTTTCYVYITSHVSNMLLYIHMQRMIMNAKWISPQQYTVEINGVVEKKFCINV